jgi:hypothetical protein
MATAYTQEEVDAIANWLVDDLSAGEIARRLSDRRRCHVSRSAIIGIVHRNKRLKAIGLSRDSGGQKKQPMRASNIGGKKEGRAFGHLGVPVVVKARLVDDGVTPHVYDGAARHVPLAELKPKECRWPVNHAAQGEPHLFCGMPSEHDVYCPHHRRRAAGEARAA